MEFLHALDHLSTFYGVILGGLLGAIFGSFIAAMVLRWPKGQTLNGRSQCDSCGRKLAVMELLPLLSYFALRGRCRSCGARIDPFHLQVEAGAAAIGAISLFFMPTISGWIWAIMGWMLLPLILLDARNFWLPDRLVFPLALMGLLIAGPLTGADLESRWIGAVAGGLLLLAAMQAYRLMRGRDGMGGGDPKLLAALGAWIGWQALPFALLIASGTGILWALLSQQKGDQPLYERPIPFGIFLGAGGWISAAIWPMIAA